MSGAALDRGCVGRLSVLADPGQEDAQTRQRVDIRDTMCSPFTGLGKPEPLKWELQGAWSRRIDSANRLVYMVDGGDLCILSVRDHY